VISLAMLDTAQKWTAFLQTAGGWGVAVVFMGISLKLYLDNKKRDDKMDQLLERRHEQFYHLMEESVTTMRAVTDFLTRNEQTFPELKNLLERIDRTIRWCEANRGGAIIPPVAEAPR
jgi:hypothetical protein